jgi:5-methylcytosine-specific restriction endonuclease McrA
MSNIQSGIEKKCSKCGVTKSLDKFPKRNGMKDGHRNECAECCNKVLQKWKIENPEKAKAHSDKWRKANPEKTKARSTAWRKANPEKAKAYSVKWSKANPEKIRAHSANRVKGNPVKKAARQAKWLKANKERYRAICAKWAKANREKVNATEHKRRARKLAAGGSFTGEEIKKMLKNQKGKCVVCKVGITKLYHIDHIMPLARGGHNGITNIQLLCPNCNRKKNAKHPIDFMQENGFLL